MAFSDLIFFHHACLRFSKSNPHISSQIHTCTYLKRLFHNTQMARFTATKINIHRTHRKMLSGRPKQFSLWSLWLCNGFHFICCVNPLHIEKIICYRIFKFFMHNALTELRELLLKNATKQCCCYYDAGQTVEKAHYCRIYAFFILWRLLCLMVNLIIFSQYTFINLINSQLNMNMQWINLYVYK